jgi:DNA-binding transcriptional regulator YiaG
VFAIYKAAGRLANSIFAQEFLGLGEEEAAYVDLKLTLSENLEKRRQRKNLTQVEFAKMLKSNQSRVAKMEAGDP